MYIIFQPILAGIFCFFYLRNLKLRKMSSLFGGFIFGFSGFTLVWLEYGIVGHAGLWLPLVLLTVDKLIKKPSGLWISVGSFAVGFSFLAGYPQISFFLLLTALVYAVYRIFVVARSERRRKVLAISAFFLLGILLSSAQLLPGLELWRLSIRQVDPTAAAFDYGLNPLKNLILFLAPDFYGNPSTGNFWGWGAYNESASYVGVAGFLLAMIAFFGFRGDKVLTFFKSLLV